MRRVFLLLFLILLSCSSVPRITFDNTVSFNLELAKTDEEKAKGLMFREYLPKRSGMLFIFEDTAPRSFWMKNTLIPLDMIFLDESMTVVEIKQKVPPCKADPCPSYPSKPAKYVLEINAGIVEKNNINVGSKAKLT